MTVKELIEKLQAAIASGLDENTIVIGFRGPQEDVVLLQRPGAIEIRGTRKEMAELMMARHITHHQETK